MRNLVQAICISVAVVLVGGMAWADTTTPALGDVNGDGSINVLDVQAAICQALQLVPQTVQANVDEKGQVDVTDVQNLINTSLGTGGLVQRIQGSLAAASDVLSRGVQLAAVSLDGNLVTVPVNATTGSFSITVPVKKGWMFVFVTESDGVSSQETDVVQFPIADSTSTVLPLLDLSQCDVLNFGSHQFRAPDLPPWDICSLLATINHGDTETDADNNGVPDFLDNLFTEILRKGCEEWTASAQGWFENMCADLPAFERLFVMLSSTCIQQHMSELKNPSSMDSNDDGIPDFMDPFFRCLVGGKADETMATLIAPASTVVPVWIDGLNLPDMTDANSNGIPDRMESLVGTPSLPAAIDANANGIPDVLENGKAAK